MKPKQPLLPPVVFAFVWGQCEALLLSLSWPPHGPVGVVAEGLLLALPGLLLALPYAAAMRLLEARGQTDAWGRLARSAKVGAAWGGAQLLFVMPMRHGSPQLGLLSGAVALAMTLAASYAAGLADLVADGSIGVSLLRGDARRLRKPVLLGILLAAFLIGVIGVFPVASRRLNQPPPTPHYAPRYSVTALGLGRPSFGRLAVSAGGDVVGGVETSVTHHSCCGSYPVVHAALWHRGVVRDLGSLGPDDSEATAISASGLVAGVYDAGRLGPGGLEVMRGFLWGAGRMRDLGTLGGANCAPSAVNAAGLVVGKSDIAARTTDAGAPGYPISRAFLWRRGVMTDLTPLAGPVGAEDETEADGVTDDGVICGTVNFEGVLWDHGRVRRLGIDEATAISGAGEVVGGDALWSGGHRVRLPMPAGYPDAAEEDQREEAVNGRREVVGQTTWNSGRADAEGGRGWSKTVAFVFHGGQTYDLNSLIPAASGWDLVEAQSVNDSGWIAGWGKFRGREQAFLLRPLRGVW